MKIELPYGKSSIKFSLPEGRLLGVLENREFGHKNVKKLLLRALRQASVPFRKKKVLIVVPDATRNAHLKEILPILIDKISTPGRSIDIIIATGLHQRHTWQELEKLLGSPILKKYKVLQHDPSARSVINFGKTKYSVPVTLDKALLDYDLLISIGIVEPHLYAGYSGGAKTISIGLAGKETINATHGIMFVDDPGTNIGSLKDNKFQQTLWHIIENIPPVLSVNTVNDQEGRALKVSFGPVKYVFNKSADFAKKVFEIRTDQACDVAICGIGYPKDINLYQASRALNYVLSVDRPVVRRGGVMIVASELKDGIGHSSAEKRFYDELKNMTSPAELISRIKREGCVAGEHRAYMVARALADYHVIFVNTRRESFMEGLPFKFYTNMDEALAAAEKIVGKSYKIFVIPHALATIPRQTG